MDALAQQVEGFLELMNSTTLLVSETDKANIDILLTMLGPIDKDIVQERYGLFGTAQKSLDEIALKHGVAPSAIAEIIAKDLRKIAITPEWQMMTQGFSDIVKRKIGLK